jgi:hypothetical protein
MALCLGDSNQASKLAPNPMPESFHAVSSGVPIRLPTEVRLVDPIQSAKVRVPPVIETAVAVARVGFRPKHRLAASKRPPLAIAMDAVGIDLRHPFNCRMAWAIAA